jgi:hypothetical protein
MSFTGRSVLLSVRVRGGVLAETHGEVLALVLVHTAGQDLTGGLQGVQRVPAIGVGVYLTARTSTAVSRCWLSVQRDNGMRVPKLKRAGFVALCYWDCF